MKTVAIIPAAGKPKIPLFPNTFDPMLPINGVPAIKHIVANLQKAGVNEFIIVLHKDDTITPSYLPFIADQTKCTIQVVFSDKERGPGYSVLQGLSQVTTADKIIINLGDTIYRVKDITPGNKIIVSEPKRTNPSWWDFVEQKGEMTFHNKPQAYQGGKIICGYYECDNHILLQKIMHELDSLDRIEIIDILKAYSKLESITLVSAENNWFDLGHLDGYYQAKMELLRTRGFNSLSYDPFKGIIIKRSTHHEKLLWEINWYHNLPSELKIFTPRLVKFDVEKDKPSYSLEFYGYPSLADLLLYGDMNVNHWNCIIKRLLDFQSHIRNTYQTTLSKDHYHSIYVTKTQERLDTIRQIPQFQKLTNFQTITINGITYKNPLTFITSEFLADALQTLYSNRIDTIIHGDFCCSNILYDIYSGIFKLIDPRGKFGESSIYGDQNYDLAKLRHSIHGGYEKMIADLFTIEYNDDTFTYTLFQNTDSLTNIYDKMLSELTDLRTIRFIEGILFLSMIPIHSDFPSRQMMMFVRSAELLDEFQGGI